MERAADHSTPEPASHVTEGDRTETVPDHADTSAEAARLDDRWRRALADLDNLRKRYAKDLERERAAEVTKVSAAWLPVLDNLERRQGDPRSGGAGAVTVRFRASRRGRSSVLPAIARSGQRGGPARPSVRDRDRRRPSGLRRGRTATAAGVGGRQPPRGVSTDGA
jgi:hypothetical protein